MESIPPKRAGRLRASCRAAIRPAISSPACLFPAVRSHRLARHVHGRRRCPRLLVLLIRCTSRKARSSRPARGKAAVRPVSELVRHWKIALYVVVLMTAFNFFSHGTQDLYPTFLQKQHQFDTHTHRHADRDPEHRRDRRRLIFGICRSGSGAARTIVIAACWRCRSSRCGPSARPRAARPSALS